MRFYYRLFFCFLLFLSACNPEEVAPADILPKHQMSLLLMDIHIVDGTLYNIPSQPDSLAKHGMAYYTAVFKAHHTDSVQFKKSLHYFSMHPVELNQIYEGILRRLKVKVDSVQKIDSLERLKAKPKNALPQ